MTDEMKIATARDIMSTEISAAGDILTPTLPAVPENMPIREIARTMVTGRVRRLLVTRNGKVVGIVTSLDLLKPLCGTSKRELMTSSRPTARSPG